MSATGPITSKRPKPSPGQPGLLELDPEGNVILAIGAPDPGAQPKKRFLVSSKVLSLALPVFSKMFSLHFSEGIWVRNGEVPCISLEEDDADITEIILRLIHSNHMVLWYT